MGYLEKINDPSDLKKLNIKELGILADEIRAFMLDILSKKGGHIAPNLGAVELTLALHYVFDSPRDKIIFDVGHQGYTHKIITGRRKLFHTIREFGGISGFLRPSESPHDIFGAGHASTSLSAALGIAKARDLKGENFKVVAVIGDGALTGGMALEALNQGGHLKPDLIIILNDNEMSIAENVGALSTYLAKLVTSPVYNKMKDDVWDLLGKLPSRYLSKTARDVVRKIKESLESFIVPTIIFEELGYRYVGPLNGHDLETLIETLERVKNLRGPTLVHVITKKGKGFKPAEEKPELFHGLGPFDIKTGEPIKKPAPPSYTQVFGKTLVELAEQDERIVAITAAMPLGTGLVYFRERFPERYFDVGIAEQHAVTFAAGLSLQGFKPFVAIYSTFLQRAFDQIIHDVALQRLPIRFGIDRGGLVGEDGPTHHGAFDLSYLRIIPNMVVMAPKDEDELRDMIKTALMYENGPIAFRYPRSNGVGVPMKESPVALPIGKGEVLKDGDDLLILAVGSMVHPSLLASNLIEKEKGVSVALVNARFIKPLDGELLLEYIDRGVKNIVTVEENALPGGFGSGVMEFLVDNRIRGINFMRMGLPDRFIEHGKREKLLDVVGLTHNKIAKKICKFLEVKTKYAL
jgi:1-deoxy-D-xylulose-5-phosphate synthase